MMLASSSKRGVRRWLELLLSPLSPMEGPSVVPFNDLADGTHLRNTQTTVVNRFLFLTPHLTGPLNLS